MKTLDLQIFQASTLVLSLTENEVRRTKEFVSSPISGVFAPTDEPNFVNLTPAVKGARSNSLATDRREQEDLCGVVNEGGDVRVGSTVVWCWRKSLEIPPPM